MKQIELQCWTSNEGSYKVKTHSWFLPLKIKQSRRTWTWQNKVQQVVNELATSWTELSFLLCVVSFRLISCNAFAYDLLDYYKFYLT